MLSRVIDQRYGEQQTTKDVQKWITAFLLRSYAVFMKVPLLRSYVLKVRKRMAILQIFDEYKLRTQTMKATLSLICSFGTVISILVILNSNVMFLLTLLIISVVIHGLILEGYVNRIEKQLLEQMLQFLVNVRHFYHRHGMLIDAIDESAETSKQMISRHVYRICEALQDAEPDNELQKYYETAPNRFLKAFAGISRMIMEYGDRKSRDRGSLYLRGIASITGEIQLDLLRRSKLDYVLKGLHYIALMPLVFTKPVEVWARSNFPLMDQFYLSKAGIIIKLGLFITILLCYIMLQKLKAVDESSYRAHLHKVSWESKLFQKVFIRKMVCWFSPKPGSESHYRMEQLLKDSNQPLRVEWFQVRRVFLFIVCTLFMISICMVMHMKTREWIVVEPPESYTFLGTLSEEDDKRAMVEAKMDAKIMQELNMSSEVSDQSISEVASMVMTSDQIQANEVQLSSVVIRVKDKLDRWNNEYLKWWEVVISIVMGMISYHIPMWILMFQKKMRLMDMKHEIYQYQSVISILREFERISVEEILEWIHTYAVIFRTSIQKCLLHFGHGAEEALLELKGEVTLEEFKQLVDKLLLANDKITITQAFDDLDSEMAFHFERRRLDYEKSLDVRTNLGQMIGFTPLYGLVFAYLVIPLIWMSFMQMDFYFEQIQNL